MKRFVGDARVFDLLDTLFAMELVTHPCSVRVFILISGGGGQSRG